MAADTANQSVRSRRGVPGGCRSSHGRPRAAHDPDFPATVLLIVGLIVLFASILGGYVLHHGHLLVLLQWSEFLIIGGAGLGAFVVANPMPVIKGTGAKVAGLLKPDPYTPAVYQELLTMIYEVAQLLRKDGFIGLEAHIEDPSKSELFRRYPFFLKHHHALHFLTDTLKSLSAATILDYNLAETLDSDLERHHAQEMAVPNAVTRIADAMPGFGIVAAVLGVVITMGSIGGSATEVGEKVAAALVGTFLGILLSYGVLGPIATAIEARIESEGAYLYAIRAALLSFSRGDNAGQAVENARRNIEPHLRPTFAETERFVKQKRAA